MFDAVSWSDVLVPKTPLLEIAVRGTLVYFALFCLLRVVLKRQSTNLGVTDLLVIVLIADASQNAMTGSYKSVSDGVALVAVIVFWSYAFDWLGYHYPVLQRLLKPKKLQLVADGKPLWRNMAKELVTMDELYSQLREQGVAELDQVREAYMEPSGIISVITFDAEQHARHREPTL